MSRKAKPQLSTIRLGPAIKICVICLVIGAAAIGYVGQKSQLQTLAGQYRDLELKLAKLRRDNAARTRILDALQTPAELEARIVEMDLGLIPPQPDQIVRLVERAIGTAERRTNRMYAERTSETNNLP